MKKPTCALTESCEHKLGFWRYSAVSDKNERTAEAVRQLLLTLTESQREAVSLCLLDGLSPAEVSKILCVPNQVVYSRIHSARKRLKQNTEYFNV